MKLEGLPQLQGISNWLQLSDGLPLTLCVFEYYGIYPVSEERCDVVIYILNQHSGRWHKLLLCLPSRFFHRFCGTSPPSSLWDLHLMTTFCWCDTGNVLQTFGMRSRSSPTHLTTLGSRSPVSAFDIMWGNLTPLNLSLILFNGCIKVILPWSTSPGVLCNRSVQDEPLLSYSDHSQNDC